MTIRCGAGRVVQSKTTTSQAKLSRTSDSNGWSGIFWEPLYKAVQDGNAVIEVTILSLSPLSNQVGLNYPLIVPHAALSPLALYFNSQDFSDCTVIIQGGPRFSCHALVLAAASPVFRAMLSNEMAEAKSKEIILKEVSKSEALNKHTIRDMFATWLRSRKFHTMCIVVHCFCAVYRAISWNGEDVQASNGSH
jgi:hypothetical protein